MKKRYLIIVTVLMLIFTAASACAEEVTYTLSLEDAIQMAVEDNPQFISADTKIKNAEKQLEEAKKDQRNVKGVIRLPDGLGLATVKKGYYVEQARIGVESAKREKTQAENTLAYDVTQKYYSLKLAEALYASAEDAYQLASENKAAIDAQFELGLVAQLDADNAAYAVAQAKAACDMYGRNLELAKESFMITLQIDGEDAQLILTDGIEYEEFSTNVEEDISKAMETRLDIYSLKSVFEQSERYLDVTLLLGSKSSEYSAANQAMVQSEYTYTNSKKLIGLSIMACYNDILNASDSLKLAQQNLELRTQEYNIAKLQYDIGMLTNTQLTGALNAVTSAKIELENAKLTYKLAVEKYGYEITIGLN